MYTDGASAQGADLQYGLNFGGAAPQALQKHDRWAASAASPFSFRIRKSEVWQSLNFTLKHCECARMDQPGVHPSSRKP